MAYKTTPRTPAQIEAESEKHNEQMILDMWETLLIAHRKQELNAQELKRNGYSGKAADLISNHIGSLAVFGDMTDFQVLKGVLKPRVDEITRNQINRAQCGRKVA